MQRAKEGQTSRKVASTRPAFSGSSSSGATTSVFTLLLARTYGSVGAEKSTSQRRTSAVKPDAPTKRPHGEIAAHVW